MNPFIAFITRISISAAMTMVFIFPAYGQQNRAWNLNGYITNMQSVMFDSLDNQWANSNLLHNRLNFFVYPSNNLKASIQLRNRFIYGDEINQAPDYKNRMEEDKGWMDLTSNLSEGNSYLLHSTIDRLWLQYTLDNFEVTLGRQRINWGQTFVWNPNDIFNVYSFFEVDYPERPGSDALRLQYYPSFTSAAEMAFKVDSAGDVTGAGYYRFNKWGYDMQFLAGVLNFEDYVLGTGWSGNLLNMSVRGEASYFHSIDNYNDTTGYFYLSLNAGYYFSNSLNLQGELLYNGLAADQNVSGFLEFYDRPLSVKNLSLSEWSVFVQGAYPVTPLINTSLSAMYLTDYNGFYFGPSVDFSLSDNATFSFIYQYFQGKFPDLATGLTIKQQFNLGFLRLKYSF